MAAGSGAGALGLASALGSGRAAGRRGAGAAVTFLALVFLLAGGGEGAGSDAATSALVSALATGSDGSVGAGASAAGVGLAFVGATVAIGASTGAGLAEALPSGVELAVSLVKANAPPASNKPPAKTSGSLLPRCLRGGYVSSSTDDEAATGNGAAATTAAGLRVCPGMVCATRARSSFGGVLSASASLITTAGVDG